MLDLNPKDFHRIRSVLEELVRESTFFPSAAQDDDWFRPHEENARSAVAAGRSTTTATAALNEKNEKRRLIRAQSEDGHRPSSSFARRPRCLSMDSLESSSTTETSSASLSSISSSSFGHPKSLIEVLENTTPTKKKAMTGHDDVVPNAVSTIREQDVEPRSILGMGGFCEVRLAKLKMRRNNEANGSNPSSDTRQLYAMKYLIPPKECIRRKEDVFSNASLHPPSKIANRNKRFVRGIADLAIEARFLALLSHDNIISLHYISRGSFEEQYISSNHQYRVGFFLLLDPMFETLSKRFDETYIPQVLLHRPTGSSFFAKMKTLRRMLPLTRQMYKHHSFDDISDRRRMQLNVWKMHLAQRLAVVKGIASALQYMHDDCHVIFRDIKPDNIGFYRKPHPSCHCGRRSKQTQHLSSAMEECTCYDEIPKLFDFGLCKELKSKYLKAHPHHGPLDKVDTYNLTARSGSRRYMAPEVARSQPYNEKADVYSFGVLLYQMASLIKPFEGYSLVEHEDEVLCRGRRPNLEIPSAKVNTDSSSQWFAPRSGTKSKDMLELRTKCVWTEELKQLIDECWQGDMRLRPEMRDVVIRLERCLQELTVTKQTNASSNSNEVKRMAIQSNCFSKALQLCAKSRSSSKEAMS